MAKHLHNSKKKKKEEEEEKVVSNPITPTSQAMVICPRPRLVLTHMIHTWL